MIPSEQILHPEVRELAQEAETFISSQSWCARVEAVNLAWGSAGVLGVFQVRLTPAKPMVDPVLWVVVGDLPSAYLVIDDAPTWRDALQAYVQEMSRWVASVREGQSLSDVIPVTAEPTLANARLLEVRLQFIEREILAVPEGALASDA